MSGIKIKFWSKDLIIISMQTLYVNANLVYIWAFRDQLNCLFVFYTHYIHHYKVSWGLKNKYRCVHISLNSKIIQHCFKMGSRKFGSTVFNTYIIREICQQIVYCKILLTFFDLTSIVMKFDCQKILEFSIKIGATTVEN